MKQVQANGKTSAKRANINYYEPSKKKIATRLTTTSRVISPKSILTEQQQQQVQQHTLPPTLPQQHTFPQHALSQQHTLPQQQYDPQLYNLPLTSPQRQNPNFNQLEIEQARKDEGEEEGDYQDPSDEKSGNKWGHDEIKALLDYTQENFSAWSKGNKTKFYNDMTKSVLPNKEANAIKSKLARLIKMYESIKKHNSQTGNERKNWCWYDKMDTIFGVRENITPPFPANRETDTIIEEEIIEIEEENRKQKQKLNNNVEVIATVIAEISQAQERIWEKKMVLEKERLEVEKERWAYERERSRMEFELRMKELDLKLQKKD